MWSFKKRKLPFGKIHHLGRDMSLLQDSAMLDFLEDSCKGFGARDCSNLIVALSLNSPSNLQDFARRTLEDRLEDVYSPNWGGYANFYFDAWEQSRSSKGAEYEVGTRRCMYLFISAHLIRMQQKAVTHTELWDRIASIWVLILESAMLLPKVMKETSLWDDEDVDYFRALATPERGLQAVEAAYLPEAIRWHKTIKDWRERDIDQATLDEINQIMKDGFGSP